MADKTITARLRLVTKEWEAGTKRAAQGLTSLGNEGKKTSQQVGRNWEQMGKATADLGSSLSTRLTVPILAVGGATAKMAMDWGAQFDQMVALAGVASSEVEGLKESVLGLSEETGRGPAELADALYFIRGAGLSGEAAMQALEVSAKAAAAGLGSTAEVANAVTNVMNAYGAANISAAEAGDILVASVTAAKVEASEMAPQFGRLLPVAAELGIEFDDVAGALAFLTTSSGDAAQASTGLNGVMRKLLQPSQQGADALRSIGLEASDLRRMLGTDGLDGTVAKLRERLGDVGFRKLFDDSEALAAALQMTGANAEQLGEIMDDVENSTGALDDAFQKTDNDSRKAQVAWAKAQGAMIRFGEAVVPVVTILTDLASAAVGLLGHMPDELRTAIVMFGALLAAAGPLLTVFGKVTGGLSAYSKWLETSELATGRFGNQLQQLPAYARGAAMAIGAIGVALAGIEIFSGQRESRTRGWIENMIGDPGTLDEVRSSIAEVRDELAALEADEGKGRLLSIGDNNLFVTSGDADRQEKIDQLRERMAELEAQEESLVGQEAETAAAFVGTADAAAGFSEETSNAVQAVQDFIDAQTALLDPLFGMIDALDGNKAAQADLLEAQEAMNTAIRDHGEGSAEATEATLAYNEALTASGRSALDVEAATAMLEAGIASGTISVADAEAAIDSWVQKGLYPAGTAASDLKGRVAGAAGQVERISGTHHVTLRGHDSASGVISGVRTALDQLNGRTATVGITANISGAAQWAAGIVANALGRASGGPVSAGRLYEVAEHGRAELLHMKGRDYLIPGSDGTVVPAGPMASAASLGGPGGGNTYITVDMGRGIFVGNQRDFRRAVQKAFNEANRKGRGVNA